MTSIIATTQDAYKGYWCFSDINAFMDQSKAERPTSRHPYPAPLTDPSSLQSYLSAEFSIPSQQPLELKLPDKSLSRKRKASPDDELAMSQPFQRVRREEATIDPQSLNTQLTTASYTPAQYAPAAPAVTTSSYPSWQESPLGRATAAPEDPSTTQASYSYIDSSSSMPSSYSVSQRSSITSTGSQPLSSVYASQNPFQAPYPQAAYSQTPGAQSVYASSNYANATYTPSTYAQPPYPPSSYAAVPWASPTYASQPPPLYPSFVPPSAGPPPPPMTLESSRAPRPRTQSHPQAALPSSLRPNRTYPDIPPPLLETPKPKPQCWEHGCNGREFSTFSNLLRHQRERRGTAPRAVCPRCGAEFTRSTARTNHLLNSKCKPRRGST